MVRTRGDPAAKDLEPSLADGTTNSNLNRVVQAAQKCFERYGVKKTTIEDIADASGLARPTFYRYFTGKDDVLRYICELEIKAVNQEIRQRVARIEDFDALLAECLLLTTRIAHENRYVRMLIESPTVVSKGADPKTEEFKANRAVWARMLDLAKEKGELAADLPLDQVMSWLVLAESMLLVKVDAASFSDGELRLFIRRFIVEPILASSNRSP